MAAKRASRFGDSDRHRSLMAVADALHACRLEIKEGEMISQEDLLLIATHVQLALTKISLRELGYRHRREERARAALHGVYKRLAKRLPLG